VRQIGTDKGCRDDRRYDHCIYGNLAVPDVAASVRLVSVEQAATAWRIYTRANGTPVMIAPSTVVCFGASGDAWAEVEKQEVTVHFTHRPPSDWFLSVLPC